MLSGMLGGFKTLIDAHAVDIIHPDLVSAGGILETKKIAGYAEEEGAGYFEPTPEWDGTGRPYDKLWI